MSDTTKSPEEIAGDHYEMASGQERDFLESWQLEYIVGAIKEYASSQVEKALKEAAGLKGFDPSRDILSANQREILNLIDKYKEK